MASLGNEASRDLRLFEGEDFNFANRAKSCFPGFVPVNSMSYKFAVDFRQIDRADDRVTEQRHSQTFRARFFIQERE